MRVPWRFERRRPCAGRLARGLRGRDGHDRCGRPNYFPAQNFMFLARRMMARAKQIPPESVRRDSAMIVERLAAILCSTDWRPVVRRGLLVQGPADVDEVVSDDAEPDPAFHSSVALVAAAVEAVSALGDADAPPRIRCAISGPGGTIVSSARACARGSWWCDSECTRLTPLALAALSLVANRRRRPPPRGVERVRAAPVDVDGADQKVASLGRRS